MKNENALPIGSILQSQIRTYRVVEVLGSGTFGITYKAASTIMVDNVDITTFFAIKEYFLKTCFRGMDGCTVNCVPNERHTFEECMMDFMTEGQRLNHLSGLSKNIVRVNEVFQYNGTAYYVMKYLDGGNVEDYIKTYGAMNEANALSIIRQIADAVCKIHNENLLHLDIKPSNIVLMNSSDMSTPCPVLIDFGISKHFTSSGKPTSAKFAKGASDGYSPMEQYASIPVFSPQLDVYALGATLLHLISGMRPPTAFEVNPEAINWLIPPSISNRTRNAVINAMQPQSANRTPTAEAFLAALGEEQAQSPVYIQPYQEMEVDYNKTRSLRSYNQEYTPTPKYHSNNKYNPQQYSSNNGALKRIVLTSLVIILSVGFVIGMFLLAKKCKSDNSKEKMELVKQKQAEADSLKREKAIIDSINILKQDSINSYLYDDEEYLVDE